MKALSWLLDLGKELLAFFVALYSVCLGLILAVSSFALAAAIRINLWVLLPCALTAVFLVIIPRYIYAWRYNFPEADAHHHRSKSPLLRLLRRESSF